MKKIMLLALSLLAVMSSAWAAHWTVNYTPTGDDAQTETYIYAVLQLPDANSADGWTNYAIGDDSNGSAYEVAAFIDDEVRAVEVTPTYDNPAVATHAERSIWRLKVIGGTTEATQAKKITFKVYDKNNTGAVYTMTATSLFTGEAQDPGIPSNPLKLRLQTPQRLTLADFTLNVGETQNLLEKLTVEPENATLPDEMNWDADNSGAYTISNNQLTAVSPAKEGVSLSISVGNSYSQCTVTILQPATSLTLRDVNEITVSNNAEGEGQLTEFLSSCYTILPENTTDEVTWTSANESIVRMVEGGTSPTLQGPGDVVLTGTANGHTIQVTVHVTQPVTGISSRFGNDSPSITYLECSVGDDLTPYLVEGKAFDILPANATNKSVTISPSLNPGANTLSMSEDGKVTATEAGNAQLIVSSVDNPEATTIINVRVHCNITSVSFEKNNISVVLTEENQDISQEIAENVVLAPADAEAIYNDNVTVTSSTPDVVTIGDVHAYKGQQNDWQLFVVATAKASGQATITVSFDKKDYLAATFDSNGNHVTTVNGTFTVNVTQGLTGISVVLPENMVIGEAAEVVIAAEPEGAELDIEQVTLTGSTSFGNWEAIEVGDPVYDEESGNYTITITPLVPGSLQVTATYGDNELGTTTDPANVGAPMEISTGWQWKTIYYGDPVDYTLQDIFGTASENKLTEIRTEEEQMYNDPIYGYFGDMQLLAQNRCFKVKANEEMSYVFEDGTLGAMEDIVLHQGWNWIPNPYFFSRNLNNIFGSFEAAEGDVIMSKTDGFAEFNGTNWTGSLQLFTRGQGYLYYRNAEEANLTYADEAEMEGQDDAAAGNRNGLKAANQGQIVKQVAGSRLFSYDPSRFSDNMGVVAVIDGIAHPENYSIVAFVGDECRGEGVCVDGRMFITVHANKGEMVSFRLCNDITGDLYAIDQTLRMSSKVGSLKAPFAMTAPAATTGISTVGADKAATVSRYDLSGRTIKGAQQGVNILRSNDGTVRKVVVK